MKTPKKKLRKTNVSKTTQEEKKTLEFNEKTSKGKLQKKFVTINKYSEKKCEWLAYVQP